MFLNVDLDLYDSAGVGALVGTLKRKMRLMHRDETLAALELAAGTTPPLDDVLNGLVDVVEAIPKRARTLWRRCHHRRMNVGIEAGDEDQAGRFVIPLPTLKRLVAIGCELELTIYACPGRKRSSRAGARKSAKSRGRRYPSRVGSR